jgi:predicted porin
MKKVLLGTSALLGAGLVASPAFAADGIKLGIGGFFRTAIEGNWDNSGSGDLGNHRYNDSVDSDGEIYFTGKTTLDNGLTVGARVELEAENSSDQIDAAYAYFQGGFGEVRIGSQNGAMMAMCVTPVGGTANFGAFSQDQVLSNAFQGYSNGICNSVDGFANFNGEEHNRSQKIVYITPNFGGFQLGLSWSPNGGHESTGVTDFHSGQPTAVNGEQRNVVDAYANFSHDFDSWSISWGGGGSWALSTGGNEDLATQTQPDGTDANIGMEKNSYYQTGLNLTFGGFSIGAAGEYYHNFNGFTDGTTGDGWVVGGGMAYTVDAWTVGLQYSHGDWQFVDNGAGRKINTAALTGNYAMGPGIALDATLQYTWANNGNNDDAAHGGYHAFGVGLGTSFEF